MSAEQRGDLAESLVPVAGELAFTVRTEGPDAIGAWLDRHGFAEGAAVTAEARALLIVLAARVDIDTTDEEQYSWVTWDEEGAPLDGTMPLLPVVAIPDIDPPRRKPAPAAHEMPQLRAAHAEATRLARAGIPVPDDLKAADSRYRAGLRRDRIVREAVPVKEAATEDEAA